MFTDEQARVEHPANERTVVSRSLQHNDLMHAWIHRLGVNRP